MSKSVGGAGMAEGFNLATGLTLSATCSSAAIAWAGRFGFERGPALWGTAALALILAGTGAWGWLMLARGRSRFLPLATAGATSIAALVGVLYLFGTLRHTGLLTTPTAALVPLVAVLATAGAAVRASRAPKPETGMALGQLAVRGGVGVVVGLVVAAVGDLPGMHRDMRRTFIHWEDVAMQQLQGLQLVQEQWRQMGMVDQDKDGMGECGLFAELGGFRPPRPSLMPPQEEPFHQFSREAPDKNGIVHSSFYAFRMFLPGSNGPVTDDAETEAAALADPKAADAQEARFVCYAWPPGLNAHSKYAFFVDQTGNVYGTEMKAKAYGGATSMPAVDAARVPSAGAGQSAFEAPIADGVVGRDGNVWVLLRPAR